MRSSRTESTATGTGQIEHDTLAQVNGLRENTSLEERVDQDNYYIENWSPWLDLNISSSL